MASKGGFPRTIEGVLFGGGQPDSSPAIVGIDGAELTYGGLRRNVRSVAGSLRAAGFAGGDRIALALPNGPLLAAAIMAVSSSYACAPLNPGFREGEFRHHLGKLRVKALVVEEGCGSPARDVARAMGLPILEASGSGDGAFSLAGLGVGEPRFAGEGDDAFLLHTSGTTAVPKLVPLTQSNICHTAHYIGSALELGPSDRCLNVMTLFHGLGLVSLLTTLLFGGSIVCAPGFAPGSFFGWLEGLRPTWYTAVPPIHQTILDMAGSQGGGVPKNSLRFIRSAAAPLSPRLMLALEALFKVPVLEAYGMTEAFMIGSSPPPPRKRKPGSVGVAEGPEVGVMDEAGGFVGAGRTGEIVVRGPNVMRGYEGEPRENEGVFVDGWMRTGDLGHIDAEGYIFIDGRVKEIINRGGEKVTPNEVDEALGAHPAVKEAATFGVRHEAMGEDVAAAVVLREGEGEGASEDDLRAFVSERLALYKVPSRIFFVREIPKGPSGKILRRRLQEALGQQAAALGGVEATMAGAGAGIKGAAKPYPRDSCIQKLFEEVAARHPDRPAIRLGKPITYGELNGRANRLARQLVSEGAKPGGCVGVLMERSVEFVVGILAVLKAGAAYVPLFPNDPPGKIAAYAKDAGVEVVLTKKIYEQMVPRSAKAVYFQSAMAKASEEDGENLGTHVPADSPAYALFVPDETGRWKGASVPHRAVVRQALGSDCAAVDGGDVVAQHSNPNTGIAAWEIWGTLLNGAEMLIINMRTMLNPREFAKRLRGEGVTMLCLPAHFFNLYAKEVPSAFSSLRGLVITGDGVSADAVIRVMESGPPGRMVNAYGAAETTALAVCHAITRSPSPGEAVPIGAPSANTVAWILDDGQKPVQAGTVGELYVGGDCVSIGYLGRPESTRKSFIPDPSSHGGRVYRTGDLARMGKDGLMEHVGRLDRQVKVHGLRTEPAEVELILGRHPSVRECSVEYVRGGEAGDGRLVAYVVPSGSAKPGGDELYDFLYGKIHEHTIPSQYVWVDRLPTLSEKAGREARTGIPADVVETPGGADDVERRLISIWEEEMGIKGIGPRDNFFKIGGYSLLAVRIFSRMEEEFGVRLHLALLYRKPTVAEMAAELRKARGTEFRSLVPLRAEGRRPRLFLVHAADGEVYNYGQLVEALGEDQPVYGLKMVGLRDGVNLPPTIERMASDYIAEMKAVQPKGPYHVAGWCAGGLIAFEIAQQLARGGDPVGLVGILDFEAMEASGLLSRRMSRKKLLKDTVYLGVDVKRRAANSRVGDIKLFPRLGELAKLSMSAAGILRRGEVSLPGESVLLPERWRGAILNLIRAMDAYRLERYPGVVTVFKKQPMPTINSPDPADGWRQFAGGVVVVPVGGRLHGDMVKRPNVLHTAEKIRERMDWHERRIGPGATLTDGTRLT